MSSQRNAALATLILTLVTVAGCSTKTFYDTTRAMAENDCRRRAPSDIDSCLARVNRMSFEEYERKRSGQIPTADPRT